MSEPQHISENSRRIARNTVFLYFRMLLMMAIGLFTSRIVLEALGVDDYGVYNAVGGIVAMFGVVTVSITAAISRFLTHELGRCEDGPSERLRSIFATSVLMQLGFSAVLILVTETLGLWFLQHHMNIPEMSREAAFIVLQTSMCVMIVQLLSVPYNALIIAHERMNAYAYISILEGVLKLVLAVVLGVIASNQPVYYSLPPVPVGPSPLVYYAFMMLGVQIIIRVTYSLYCRRHFEEARTRLHFNRAVFREMFTFAGWSFYGSAMNVANTQGVTVLINVFFGVAANAARGVAMQVENIVKQFVTNFLTALNPQITKSHAAGNREYCHELVRKGGKFTSLILLFFIVPFTLEAPVLLDLWLKNVPSGAVLFSQLALLTIWADMSCNSALTLIQASGQVKGYYLVNGSVAILNFVITWVAYRMGAPVWSTYVIFVGVYALCDVVKLCFARRVAGLEIWRFVRVAILKPFVVGAMAFGVAYIPFRLIDIVWLRVICVLALSSVAVCVLAYLICLTGKEREYVKLMISKVLRRG